MLLFYNYSVDAKLATYIYIYIDSYSESLIVLSSLVTIECIFNVNVKLLKE